jgi:hypothetical protein
MAMTTRAAAHLQTTRLDIHEVAARMTAHLGPTLVAALSGTKDPKLPIRWAKAAGPRPGHDFERRLRLGHRLWTQIASAGDDHVARAWFIGGNPMLEELTPLTAIREDRDAQVMAAAEAFVHDSAGV